MRINGRLILSLGLLSLILDEREICGLKGFVHEKFVEICLDDLVL